MRILVNCIFLVLYKMQQKATKLVSVSLVSVLRVLCKYDAHPQAMETNCRHNPVP